MEVIDFIGNDGNGRKIQLLFLALDAPPPACPLTLGVHAILSQANGILSQAANASSPRCCPWRPASSVAQALPEELRAEVLSMHGAEIPGGLEGEVVGAPALPGVVAPAEVRWHRTAGRQGQ